MPKNLLQRVICVDPSRVTPPHEVIDVLHFQTISESMRANGWLGRPLVVARIGPNQYQATTGSHRHAGALEASLSKIPVLPLNAEELKILKRGLGYDIRSYRLWDYMQGAEILRGAGHNGIADLLRMDIVASAVELALPGVKPWEPQALMNYKRSESVDQDAIDVMAIEKWPCR